MRLVVQRVSRASVDVDGVTIGEIGIGLLVLVGVAESDQPEDVTAAAAKVGGLRIFPDGDGRMNLSVSDVGGAVLVVSQFTLIADVRKGRRPSFVRAADPEQAVPLIDQFVDELAGHGLQTATGEFGAMMDVSLVNDGPVTIVVEVTDGRVV